mmetsp:Transcript_20397/g.36639  ORF Transcript_20397/g.36639 Transcript_20397/m.36639 type:complete len:293 (+) Transcript_20397:239-1117(+)
MFPSMVPSLQRAIVISTTHRALRPSTIRLLSTQTTSSSTTSSSTSSSISVPPIPTNFKPTPPDKIAAAKSLITSSTNPRSRRSNQLDKRTHPTFGSLPTNDKRHERQATETPSGHVLYPSKIRYDTGVSPEDMPFLHHSGHDRKPKPKFKNPRKRASKLYNELTMEAIAESEASKPAVWNVPFRVGDAVELEVLDDGGVDNPLNKRLDVIRGVVLGRENKGLDTSIYLKDVLYGDHVERKVKLHSPMVKTLKVLEEGFVHRGKKKGKMVKRAKLYYLRDRKPEETRVTKPQK